MKHLDALVLLSKEETVLQGMIDTLIETERCYGMEINMEKTKVMRISKKTIPITDYDKSETRGECGIFQPFG
jgi:hypothetical protein